MRLRRVAHPLAVGVGVNPVGQALFVAGAVAVHHSPKIVPVDRAVVVAFFGFVPLQVGVGQGHAQHFGLRHGGVHKALAQVVVADALDAPAAGLCGVGAVSIRRAEHRQHRPPPAVDCVLNHLALGWCALHLRHQALKALALVEAFLFANSDHGAGIGAIRAAAQGNLVHDGGAVHQPPNHAHIGPQHGGVIEDAAVFGAAGVQGVQHLVAAGSQGFSGAVEVKPVAAFVLYFGNQDGLALEARCAADPVALGLHANDFRMRVLADLSHQSFAVGLGHPVLRLDLAVCVHHRIKARLPPRLSSRYIRLKVSPKMTWQASYGRIGLIGNVQGLGVHARLWRETSPGVVADAPVYQLTDRAVG